jgi:protein kinase C substrate 80K-H
LCFDQKIEKYVYKACPFGEAKQDNTQLGRNSEGVRIDADGKTMTLKFADGDACWNGPKRSLTLTLKCGDKERLAAIEEPSRCEYVGVFYAPAACDDASVFALERELSDLDRILAASSISPRDEL